jgi:hypothetical protein
MKCLTLKSAFIIAFIISSTYPEELAQKSWPHKLIFSDTPEIGKKWRGGIRMNDIVVWDLNFNINNWILIDYLKAGFKNFKPEEDGGKLTDKFTLFAIKSRPFLSSEIKGGKYKMAAGIKYFTAKFRVTDEENPDGDYIDNDESLIFFIAQGYDIKKHYVNLFSSISFREKTLSQGKKRTSTTYYMIPGYNFRLSTNWNFAFEYFMTNTEYLPIKILQYGLDQDEMEFWNSERQLVTFTIWGFNYTRKHLRIDLNIGSYSPVIGPFFPIIGIGWYF